MLKVLFVCSGNFKNTFSESQVFVNETKIALEKNGVVVDVFLIKGRGILGYIKALFRYRRVIKSSDYQLVHAFYGLSGLFANLQFNKPVITTFLGSDINVKSNRRFSKIAYALSSNSIFVTSTLAELLKAKKSSIVLPFGIDLDLFIPISKQVARDKLMFSMHDIIILFASDFNRIEKNYQLAKESISLLNMNVNTIELGKTYTREILNYLYNACDLFLMTSIHEGSPQTIKEALACNCPIVSTDVGDVKDMVGNTEGCYIASFDPEDVADKIKLALEFGKRTNGREKIKHLNDKIVAKRIFELYKEVLEIK